jgi:uncharacterized protein YndB with AHSA1/START domain
MKHNDAICVQIDLASPPAEVYRYWTEPDRYSRRMGRTLRLEPRAGGEYFVHATL